MKFSLMPLLLPAVLFFLFWLGMEECYEKRYANLALVTAAAGILALALHVWTIDNRIRDLESKLERLSDQFHESNR